MMVMIEVKDLTCMMLVIYIQSYSL